MRILLTGANGQVGKCIHTLLNQKDILLLACSKNDLDIVDEDGLAAAFKDFKPTVVINASAYTDVDGSETNPEEAFAVNHQAAASLGKLSNTFNFKLIHFSTDFVFDGNKTGKYVETDKTCPLNVYGKSKLEGEKEIIRTANEFIILRTSWVFSQHGKNFLKTIFNNLLKGNKLNIINDQYGTPTYAGDIAQAVLNIITTSKNIPLRSGIYNFAGDLPCSWLEFAIKIQQKALELDYIHDSSLINATTSKEYGFAKAIRPKNSALDSTKIMKEFKIEPSNWDDKINICIKDLFSK